MSRKHIYDHGTYYRIGGNYVLEQVHSFQVCTYIFSACDTCIGTYLGITGYIPRY